MIHYITIILEIDLLNRLVKLNAYVIFIENNNTQ